MFKVNSIPGLCIRNDLFRSLPRLFLAPLVTAFEHVAGHFLDVQSSVLPPTAHPPQFELSSPAGRHQVHTAALILPWQGLCSESVQQVLL